MKRPDASVAIAAHLTWNHLCRLRTMVAPVGLMLGLTFSCTHAVLLFWVLTCASLPFQVFGLHEMAMRLRNRMHPLDDADVPDAQCGPPTLAVGLAAMALVGIVQILYGAMTWSTPLQTTGGLATFLALNWGLLHLLMVGITLTMLFTRAGRAEAPEPDTHAAPDSRHAPG